MNQAQMRLSYSRRRRGTLRRTPSSGLPPRCNPCGSSSYPSVRRRAKAPRQSICRTGPAGSRARRGGRWLWLTFSEVAKVVHHRTQVPLERLADVDADRFANAEETLGRTFIGHKASSSSQSQKLSSAALLALLPIDPSEAFSFSDPPASEKTELVKVLAEFLFGRKDAVVRLDMSEYTEKHSIARLVGAQPGYVGHDQVGFTEALRKRPFQIVLFDEIEKGHPDVLNLLLQILDEGHLTDSKGRTVSFSNAVVVLTSNLGADALKRSATPTIGFGTPNPRFI